MVVAHPKEMATPMEMVMVRMNQTAMAEAIQMVMVVSAHTTMMMVMVWNPTMVMVLIQKVMVVSIQMATTPAFDKQT